MRRIKWIYFGVLFLIINSYTSGQNVDELFKPQPKTKTGNEVTLDVDTVVGGGKSAEELEAERQDSIKQFNDKWKAFLTDMNTSIHELLATIQGCDSSAVTKKDVKEFRLQLDDLKGKFDIKIGKGPLWEDNDELDDLQGEFLSTHRRTSDEIDELLEKVQSGGGDKGINWMIVMGVILVVAMIGFPIFNQLKAGNAMRKAKKEQQKQAKKQAEEMEKQMLLSNEDVVTLK